MTSLLNSSSFLFAFLALFAAAAGAQTPVGDLAKPPADAEHLIISSTRRKARRQLDLADTRRYAVGP